MKQDKIVTIYDVASLAGVSKGTVDRVIYNRGRVSEETSAKVKKAIEVSGYKPNLYASLLASKKKFVIGCLLPKFIPGQYWEEIYKGFIRGIESVRAYNIVPEVRFYDQYDEHAFESAYNDILQLSPNGVIFHPFFTEASKTFSNLLNSSNIPYGYVDGRIDDENYLVYYGVDLYKSGYFGGFLLTNRSDVKEVLIVRIKRDKEYKSDPTYNRRRGFVDYIKHEFPDCLIHTLFVNPNNAEEINCELERFFLAHPSVSHIIMLNSRVHLIAGFLESHPMEQRVVVGFDSIEDNIRALQNGYVDVLVSRHISMQSFNVVTALAEFIISGRKPEKRDNFMHIDVLTKYNIDNY